MLPDLDRIDCATDDGRKVRRAASGATVKRALIIGGIGVGLLGAATGLTWLDQADGSRLEEVSAIATSARGAAPEPTPSPNSQPPTIQSPQASTDTIVKETVADSATLAMAPPEPKPGGLPGFDVVRVNPQGNAVIAGRAQPHSTVTVLDGAKVIGETVANQRGEWVLLPDEALKPGGRELSLSARAPAAAEPVRSDDVVVLVLPEPAHDLTGRPSPDRSGALALAVPRDGAGVSAVLQAPPAPISGLGRHSDDRVGMAPAPPGGVTVDVVDYGTDGQVNIGGRAPARSRVQVYLDNTLIGHAIAASDGRWALTPDRPVRSGRYALRADQVAEDGRVAARAEIPFQMAEQNPILTAGQTVVVQPGHSLWRIARRTYGSGVRFSQIYEANQEQIRDPDLIYPGQIFGVPSTN